jgi:hypothetical protein
MVICAEMRRESNSEASTARLLVGLFSDATVEHVLARELLQVVLVVEPFIRRSESHIKD